MCLMHRLLRNHAIQETLTIELWEISLRKSKLPPNLPLLTRSSQVILEDLLDQMFFKQLEMDVEHQEPITLVQKLVLVMPKMCDDMHIVTHVFFVVCHQRCRHRRWHMVTLLSSWPFPSKKSNQNPEYVWQIMHQFCWISHYQWP